MNSKNPFPLKKKEYLNIYRILIIKYNMNLAIVIGIFKNRHFSEPED